MTKIHIDDKFSAVTGGTDPVKEGDRVIIVDCSNCPETNGKVGTVIRDVSLEGNLMFELDVPSNFYGEYTLMDSEFDTWALVSTEEEELESDAVSHPSHYTTGKIEVIDIIAQTVAGYEDPFLGYTLGNVIKYISRAPYKHDDPLEDLKKSREYITFAIEKLEGDSDKQKRY